MRSVKKILNNIKGNKTIVGIDSHELGPVHTILKAESFIKDNEPVIVNYSDFMMLWEFKDFMSKDSLEDFTGAYDFSIAFDTKLIFDL